MAFPFFLFLQGSPVSAQSEPLTVTGRVLNDQHEGIPSASVVISSDSLCRQGLKFGITDAKGNFKIANVTMRPGRRWITVRSLGYGEYLRALHPAEVRTPLEIMLYPENVDIEQVVVKGTAKNLYLKGDTLIFNIQNYRLGDEKSIGDVIRKMPGMEVDDGGQVFFQGKKVSKILVNGHDIFSKATGSTAISNLPPDFANQVELIRDYKGDDIASEYRNRERMALNLKSDKAGIIQATVDAAGGLINRYDGKGVLFALAPKFSASLVLSANNTGRQLYSIRDYVNRIMELTDEEGTVSFQLTPLEQMLINPPSNEYSRRNGIINLGTTYKPNPKYKLLTHTIFGMGRSESMNSADEWLFLPNGELFYHADDRDRRRSIFLSQQIIQKFFNRDDFSFFAVTDLDFKGLESDHDFHNVMPSETIRSVSDLGMRDMRISQNFQMKKLLSWGFFSLEGEGSFAAQGVGNDFATSTAILPVIHTTGGMELPFEYSYTTRQDNYRARIVATLTNKLYRTLYLESKLLLAGSFKQLHTTTPELLGLREDNYLNTYKAYVGLMRNRSKFVFNIGSYVSVFHNFRAPKPFLCSPVSLFVEPSLFMKYEFDRNHQLTLTGSYSHGVKDVSLLTQRTWAENYRYMLMPSQVNARFSKFYNAGINYTLQSLFDGLILHLILNAGRMDDIEMLSTRTKDFLIEGTFRDGGWMNHADFTFYIMKGLGALPMEISTRVKYNVSHSNYLREGIEDEILSGNLATELTLKLLLVNSPIRFELGGRYDRGDQLLRLADVTGSFDTKGGFASFGLRFKKFTANLSGVVNYIQDDFNKRWYNDMGVSVNYKFEWFEVYLNGENLFHMRRNQWLQETLSATARTSSIFHRMPGYLLLGVKFRI